MSILSSTYRFCVGGLMHNPGTSAGIVMFGLGFALIAGNAMYSQQEVHPSPIWVVEERDETVTKSVVHKLTVEPKPVSITRNVLTQRISLKNIPVPQANPARFGKSENYQSPLVRDTQDALTVLGLYSGKIDGIYGSGTKQAIINFQTSAGLLPTGEASYELLTSLKATVSATSTKQPEARTTAVASNVSLEVPASSDFDRGTIQRVQQGLKQNFGEDQIAVDGIFGKQTEDALKRFQEFFQLPQTGKLDKPTIEKLFSAGVITAI
ncbi:MAG: peptidoglycan-binding domain-containing protein [Rhizobiaceae bacterium]|nr:peptidoglycan-binding domain-containing protein [Rhizobiaceae bacterium]